MEIQLEIRKLEAKNTLSEYHKTWFDSKLVFLILLLMLTNQNKAFFIVLTNQNNIQLINKKFGSNIDGYMKKHY